MALPTPYTTRPADQSVGGTNAVRNGSLSALLGVPCHPGLSRVSCEVIASRATLDGEVPTFYLKQVAQETASRIAGVQTVENRIKVKHTRLGSQ